MTNTSVHRVQLMYNVRKQNGPALAATSPDPAHKPQRKEINVGEISLSRRVPQRDRKQDQSRTCAGCGVPSTEKPLMAPHKNARGYTGPMYCLSCNPRFVGGDAAMRWMVG